VPTEKPDQLVMKRALLSLALLSLPPAAHALTLFNDLSSHDWTNWYAADGWKNGSPFAVGWRADHVGFDASGEMTLFVNDSPCASDPALCSGEAYAGANYSSIDYYSYGRVESRFQAASGAGLVSSLFTYTGPSDGNPHDEIDIEILGQDTTKLQANYFVGGVGGHEHIIDLGFDAAAGLHTYAFEWRPDSITWYVDDLLVYSVTAAVLPTTPGRIMMNLWAVDATAEAWAGHYDGSAATSVYDYVSYVSLDQLATVPEPATPALLAAGLGFIGLCRRRA
jgi:beta-glucanase (GH16 family)